MNYNWYITKRIKDKHLTSVERSKIEALFKANLSNQVIAVFKRTIIHEKKCGMVYEFLSIRNEYYFEKAHNRYLSIQKKKQGELKNW